RNTSARAIFTASYSSIRGTRTRSPTIAAASSSRLAAWSTLGAAGGGAPAERGKGRRRLGARALREGLLARRRVTPPRSGALPGDLVGLDGDPEALLAAARRDAALEGRGAAARHHAGDVGAPAAHHDALFVEAFGEEHHPLVRGRGAIAHVAEEHDPPAADALDREGHAQRRGGLGRIGLLSPRGGRVDQGGGDHREQPGEEQGEQRGRESHGGGVHSYLRASMGLSCEAFWAG